MASQNVEVHSSMAEEESVTVRKTVADDGTSTNNRTDEALTKAEKLKRRREQLAAWRQKKESERKEGKEDVKESIEDTSAKEGAKKSDVKENSAGIEEINGKGEHSTSEDVKLARQKRIEEWKRKKALKESKEEAKPVAEVKEIRTAITLKRKAPQAKPEAPIKIRKRALFEADEDVPTHKPIFKKPNFEALNMESNDTDEEDELDTYLKTLEASEVSSAPVNVPSDESDSELDETNADEEQQKMLSERLLKLTKGKELEHVDHAAIEYEDFKKSFYKELVDLSQLSPEDVELIRLDLGGIKVKGTNCPKPILKWSQLGLPHNIATVIEEKLQYEKPSPIQAQAIPAVMSGRDLIGIAKTGSGKTISFLLPVLRQIIDQPPLKPGDGPIGLILTPTRELALQIHKEASVFAKKLGFNTCCCYGGSSIETQIAELKKGAELIIGTPGRVIDLLAANSGRVTNLKRVTYVVLDEADRMFDMGFEPQVTKIFSQVRPTKQTVLFSATFPRKMELLAKKILVDPVQVTVGGISVVAAEIEQKLELFADGPDVTSQKLMKLLEILRASAENDPEGKILIFVEKKAAADDLLVKLLANEIPCLAIHGDKEQIDRRQAIKDFSLPTSGFNVLIATSIAARGLDVKGLNLVVNYDSPNHMEDYVHRVGRTGRAGKKGTAITFVAENEERSIAELVRAIKLSVGNTQSVSPKLVEISEGFWDKVKSGEEKFKFGFGGRGLENLQEIRENNRDLQKKVYGGDEIELASLKPTLKTPATETKTNQEVESKLPTFDIVEGSAPESTGPDRCKFHSRIVVNDLPQTARWNVMQRDSLSKIIETTSTSITNKGQYYGPNAKAPAKNAPQKLYLLVEGLTEAAVRDANSMLRQKMIEGLEIAAKEESKPGKYTV